MIIRFETERATKNTIRFNEILDDHDEIYIGSVYVQKSTLEDMGYEYGDHLELEVRIYE